MRHPHRYPHPTLTLAFANVLLGLWWIARGVPPCLATIPDYMKYSRAYWNLVAAQQFTPSERAALEAEDSTFAAALRSTTCTPEYASLPLDNLQADSLGPGWMDRHDLEGATNPGSPTRTGNPLNWFRGLAADGPQTPLGRAGKGTPVGRARPTPDLMLGLDSLIALKTGHRLSANATANATLVRTWNVKVALAPFRFRGSTATWNATSAWDTARAGARAGAGTPPPLTPRADPDTDFHTLPRDSLADMEAGYQSTPHPHEVYNRQMRRRMRRMNAALHVPWANPFYGEAAVWEAVRVYVSTWVVALIGRRTSELAAAAGAAAYPLHPGRYNDTANTTRPNPPLGPRTYQWFPVQLCPSNDTFTFRVQEWTGVGYGTVQQQRIQLADATRVNDDALLDTFHTVFHRTVGLPPSLAVPRPWDDMHYATVSTYEDCEFQGQQGMFCVNPITKKKEYSSTLLREPQWHTTNRCWGDYCELWRYPATPWIHHSPQCTADTTCDTKGKCTAVITQPGFAKPPVNTRPRFADPYTRQGLQMDPEKLAFPLAIDLKFDGKYVTKKLQKDPRVEYREVYTCGKVPDTVQPLMIRGDYVYTFYHMYAEAQGVPIAANLSDTRFGGPLTGFKTPPDYLPLAQSVPHYPITAAGMQNAINKLYGPTSRIFLYRFASMAKDPWCKDDAAKGYGTCEKVMINPARLASLQELEWGVWRTRVAGVNASIKAAASALRDDLINHVFSPFASGVARVCGPGPGYLACGASPPGPASSLLQATCAPQGGTCLYGLPPGPIDWTSSRCTFDALTPEGPCTPKVSASGLAGFDLSLDGRQALVSASSALNDLRRALGALPPGAFLGDSAPPGPAKSVLGVPAVDPVTGALVCPAGMGGPSCATACGNLTAITGTTLGPTLAARTPCTALVTTPGPNLGNRDVACYSTSPGPPETPLRQGCSGHGTCFVPGTPDVCVCDAGWQGPFCSTCAAGNWGPTCDATCASPDPGSSAADADQGLTEARIWDPSRSTGVYNLTLCLTSAQWRQAAGPGGALGPKAPPTPAALATACGLWAPAASAAQWLTRARECVLPAPGAPQGVVVLGTLCNLQPQDCVPYTLSTMHASLGVTPSLLLGCPSPQDWARNRSKWTNATWAAATTALQGSDGAVEAVLGPVAQAIAAKGVAPNGTSPHSFMQVPPANMPPNCGDLGAMGVHPGRGMGIAHGCDPWILQHPNFLALVDEVGTLQPMPVPGPPPGPTSGWDATQEHSWATRWTPNLQEYLCDPIAFRWEMARRTGVGPEVGLNPVPWGVCPPEGVRPRWFAPGAAALCGDTEFFATGPGSARARHLARLGGWGTWDWQVHGARDGGPPSSPTGPRNDSHPVDGAWIRTLATQGARPLLLRAAYMIIYDWFYEPGWKPMSTSALMLALNVSGPHFKWSVVNHGWVMGEDDMGVPDPLCDIDCQMWVGMGFPHYMEGPGFREALQPLADLMNRVYANLTAIFPPQWWLPLTHNQTEAQWMHAVDAIASDLWAITRGVLLRPTDEQGNVVPTDTRVWRDFTTNIRLRQNTWTFLNLPLYPFFGNGTPWSRLAALLFAGCGDHYACSFIYNTMYPWSPLVDMYAADKAPVADHGSCSVTTHGPATGNCTGTTEVLWGPTGQFLAAMYSDTPGLPLVGLTMPPGVQADIAPTGTVEPREGMTSCAATAQGLQCWPGGAVATLVHAGVSPEFELGCPGVLTGRSPEFHLPGLPQPLVVPEETAARMRAVAAVAAINRGPEAPTLCDWDLFVATNPVGFSFQPEFVQADGGLAAPDPATLWDLALFTHSLLGAHAGGTTTSARVPNASHTGPWNATWVVEPLPRLLPNSSLQQTLGAHMDAQLNLRAFLDVNAMDAVATLQAALAALANRTLAPGCLPTSDTPSVWAFTRSTTPTPRTGARVCGGPKRAATCGPAAPGSPAAAACLATNHLPCAGGSPPANTTYNCKCSPVTGCACAPGSNLDPRTNCMTCAFGTVPLDLPLTRCTTLTACPSVAGATCSARGSCMLFGKAANGSAVAKPFNSSRVATDALGLTLLSTGCVCVPGWTGDACTVVVPTPAAAARLTPRGRNATDPAATAMAKGTMALCTASGLFVPMTGLATYWAQCDTEARRLPAAADECRRSVREVAGRPFFWAYGARGFSPRTSTIRATVRTDVQACSDAGGTLVGTEYLAVYRKQAGDLYARVWLQDLEAWEPTRSLGPLDVQWVNGQGGAADFVARPGITNSSFCIRVATAQGLATYLAPLGGRFIPGRMNPDPGTSFYPFTPSTTDVPDNPQAEECTLWAPPLCVFRHCPRGGSRAAPGSFLFQ